MPNEHENTKFYHNIIENLTSHGYNLYEISSLSKPGMQCRHNLHYWDIEPYIGFGPLHTVTIINIDGITQKVWMCIYKILNQISR